MTLVPKLADNNKKYLKKLAFFFVFYTLLVLFHVRFLSFIYNDNFEIFNKNFFLLVYPLLLIFSYLKWSSIKNFEWKAPGAREFLFYSCLSILFLLLPPQKIVLLDIDPSIATLVPFYFGVAFMFATIFTYRFIKQFGAEFLIMSYILFAYIIANMLINYLWRHLVFGILEVFYYIFPFISDNHLVELDRYNVRLENFSVYIGAPCAGIYSLVTFTLLFLTSVTLMNKGQGKLSLKKAVLFFLIGIFGVYLLNILRVLVIVLVGAYISEELAMNFFHEYLGAIFLIGIFLMYLYLVIPKLFSHTKNFP